MVPGRVGGPRRRRAFEGSDRGVPAQRGRLARAAGVCLRQHRLRVRSSRRLRDRARVAGSGDSGRSAPKGPGTTGRGHFAEGRAAGLHRGVERGFRLLLPSPEVGRPCPIGAEDQGPQQPLLHPVLAGLPRRRLVKGTTPPAGPGSTGKRRPRPDGGARPCASPLAQLGPVQPRGGTGLSRPP